MTNGLGDDPGEGPSGARHESKGQPDAAHSEHGPDESGTSGAGESAKANREGAAEAAARYRDELLRGSLSESTAQRYTNIGRYYADAPLQRSVRFISSPKKRFRWKFWKQGAPQGAVSPEEVSAEVRKANAEARSIEGDVTMKKIVGYGSLFFMLVQIGVADYVFVQYAEGNKWRIPAEVIDFWLAATVVQVAVIVRTVASYLFPAGYDPHR